MKAFEKDTVHRLLTEAARVWVIAQFLDVKCIQASPATFYAYPSGPVSFDWGEDGDAPLPLVGKRIKITLEVEKY